MKFRIAATSGFFIYIFEKKTPGCVIEAENPEEVAQRSGGMYVRFGVEHGLLVPPDSFDRFSEFIKGNNGNVEEFLKWWERGDLVERNGIKGKIFLIEEEI